MRVPNLGQVEETLYEELDYAHLQKPEQTFW